MRFPAAVTYKLTAQGSVDASVHARVGEAREGICDPAVLKMTVPCCRDVSTWVSVIRASSKEDPVGVETEVTAHPFRLLVDPRVASRKSSSSAFARFGKEKKF